MARAVSLGPKHLRIRPQVGEEHEKVRHGDNRVIIKIPRALLGGAGIIKEGGGSGFVAVAVCVAEEMVKNNNDDSSRPCILGDERRVRRQPTTALVRESPDLRVVGKRFATDQ